MVLGLRVVSRMIMDSHGMSTVSSDSYFEWQGA